MGRQVLGTQQSNRHDTPYTLFFIRHPPPGRCPPLSPDGAEGGADGLDPGAGVGRQVLGAQQPALALHQLHQRRARTTLYSKGREHERRTRTALGGAGGGEESMSVEFASGTGDGDAGERGGADKALIVVV
jgi:hypothetical protein